MTDWLMMEYAVSECSDSVKTLGEIFSDSEVAWDIGDNWLQEPRPEYFFVSYVEQACPEAEGQFRYYPSRVERLSAFNKSVFGFLNLANFLRM